MLSIFILLFTIANLAQNAEIRDEYELVLVHGIFRHGARTTYSVYPTDPHINHTYYPVGFGGLTNEGKRQEYELGKYLRKEYEGFLDKIYSEDVIETRSTGVGRTIMSAQLLLAGLFPPVEHQIWHESLPWQPIPIYFLSENVEDLLHPKNCRYRHKIENNITNDPDVYENYVKPHKKLFEYVSRHSGLNITDVHELLEFYFIISTENENNLTLPEWLKSVYPEPITSTAALTYHFRNIDENLRRINMGYLLQKMINDTKAKMEGVKSYKKKQMYLYSAHEITIGYFLDGLQLFETHIPPYAAVVLLEIRKNKSGEYFVKIRYKKGTSEKAETLKLPGCATLCPWENFLKINNNVLPKISIKEACEL